MSRQDARPDPDELLQFATAAEERARGGKLKLFFGACAGVGKTFAMLSSARQLKDQGVDVVVGLVETHGRKETMALTAGLEILPRRQVEYRGRMLEEFDIDGALARKPQVLLVDELAHNNVTGSRHPKRWQDVEELLSAGIDVYTTMNVQHLESLNDVVGDITGIPVWETVPDRIFDAAYELVLVDLPADDLLQRMKEGKVYLPEQAERASKNFFRKGNLVALRELALRRTADRVDDDVHLYRRERGTGQIWHTRERLLACIGPAPGSESVLRSTSRMASALNAEWHAVYVETPALQAMSDTDRAAVMQRLRLAETMGAVTGSIMDRSVVGGVAKYARKHNVTKLVLGRSARLHWWQGREHNFPQALSARLSDVDVVIVAETTNSRTEERESPDVGSYLQRRAKSYALAAGTSAITGIALFPLFPAISQTNIAMLFLAALIPVAVWLGRGPATLASMLNVLAFDVFFVEPRFSLAVSDIEYLLTFAVMLAVGLTIAQLTAGLKFQALIATRRHEESQDLYELARALSAALTTEQISDLVCKAVEAATGGTARLVLPDAHDRLSQDAEVNGLAIEIGVAQWAFDRARPAGVTTDTLPGSKLHYLPLKAPMRVRGVLAIALPEPGLLQSPDLRQRLDTIAALGAIAIERVHFVSVAQDTLVKIESQRLRESLLAALSHDLRTPITAIGGIAESLASEPAPGGERRRELLSSLRSQAQGMARLVANILDMARLESGKATPLHPDWQSVEELVGAARHVLADVLKDREVAIEIPHDLPLLHADGVLIERVLVNLLENAAKYVPADKRIGVSAAADADSLEIVVWDEGPGLPLRDTETLFAKFVRGARESAVSGVGLGLAICRAIVEAHGGTIAAAQRPEGGARFVVRLPLKPMPAIDAEAETGTHA